MKNTDIEMAQAAYTLSDELMDIRICLEKAETALQEPTDGYFNKDYDRRTERGRFAILCDYEKQGIFCNIASDYLYKVRVVVDALKKLELAGSELVHGKKEVAAE